MELLCSSSHLINHTRSLERHEGNFPSDVLVFGCTFYANSSGIQRPSPFPILHTNNPLRSRPNRHLSLDGELALWEVDGTLGGLLELASRVLLGEAAADGAGLLWAEVQWHVLLVLVEQAELSTLIGVDDSQDLGDSLADIVAISRVSYAVPLTSTESSHLASMLLFGERSNCGRGIVVLWIRGH